MSRIPPASPEQIVPYFGADAPDRLQVWAQAPEIAASVEALAVAIRTHTRLPRRLVELVRLRVAFHNQCRICMASRYSDAREAGVTEELVCSLERPAEAPDLTDAERAALAFADCFATDHLSASDGHFEALLRHFDEGQVMELCFRVAYLVGFGRMMAMIDVRPEELPDRFRIDGRMTPWGPGDVMEREVPSVATSI